MSHPKPQPVQNFASRSHQLFQILFAPRPENGPPSILSGRTPGLQRSSQKRSAPACPSHPLLPTLSWNRRLLRRAPAMRPPQDLPRIPLQLPAEVTTRPRRRPTYPPLPQESHLHRRRILWPRSWRRFRIESEKPWIFPAHPIPQLLHRVFRMISRCKHSNRSFRVKPPRQCRSSRSIRIGRSSVSAPNNSKETSSQASRKLCSRSLKTWKNQGRIVPLIFGQHYQPDSQVTFTRIVTAPVLSSPFPSSPSASRSNPLAPGSQSQAASLTTIIPFACSLPLRAR